MPKCRVNNVVLDNERKDNTYQAVILDLALAGIIEQDKAEALLGYAIPSKLRTPYWYVEPTSHDLDDDPEGAGFDQQEEDAGDEGEPED